MQVSSMVERLNLLTFFVLAAVTTFSIVSGYEEYWEYICKNREPYRDRGCLPMCLEDHSIICRPHCLCADGKVICDILRETCTCKHDGWKGVNCDEPCPSGFFGRNCAYECKCKSNGTCDRFSGSCSCTAGYQGSLCEEKCPNGTHGIQCSNECKCQHDAICHHLDGSCDCTAGWMRPVCAEPCPEGSYGINCSETCDCFKNAPCNVTTGECIYTDDMCDCHCDVDSPSEAKMLNDSQEMSFISNKNNSCLPGYSGTNCENRACPVNKWGQTCSNECKCKNGRFCHPVTGVCWCEIGWTGEDCSVSVNDTHFDDKIIGEEHPSSTTSLIVPVICVAVVLTLLTIIAAYLCSKKRSVRNEDNESIGSFSVESFGMD